LGHSQSKESEEQEQIKSIENKVSEEIRKKQAEYASYNKTLQNPSVMELMRIWSEFMDKPNIISLIDLITSIKEKTIDMMNYKDTIRKYAGEKMYQKLLILQNDYWDLLDETEIAIKRSLAQSEIQKKKKI